MTRAEAKAKTRAAVLDAAKRLFTLDGYYATTMRGIAARAGYSTGAVFHQFSGKDELWRETMGCQPPTEERCADLERVLLSALRQTGCDGDLCGYQWHEDARKILGEKVHAHS